MWVVTVLSEEGRAEEDDTRAGEREGRERRVRGTRPRTRERVRRGRITLNLPVVDLTDLLSVIIAFSTPLSLYMLPTAFAGTVWIQLELTLCDIFRPE